MDLYMCVKINKQNKTTKYNHVSCYLLNKKYNASWQAVVCKYVVKCGNDVLV